MDDESRGPGFDCVFLMKMKYLVIISYASKSLESFRNCQSARPYTTYNTYVYVYRMVYVHKRVLYMCECKKMYANAPPGCRAPGTLNSNICKPRPRPKGARSNGVVYAIARVIVDIECVLSTICFDFNNSTLLATRPVVVVERLWWSSTTRCVIMCLLVASCSGAKACVCVL